MSQDQVYSFDFKCVFMEKKNLKTSKLNYFLWPTNAIINSIQFNSIHLFFRGETVGEMT